MAREARVRAGAHLSWQSRQITLEALAHERRQNCGAIRLTETSTADALMSREGAIRTLWVQIPRTGCAHAFSPFVRLDVAAGADADRLPCCAWLRRLWTRS